MGIEVCRVPNALVDAASQQYAAQGMSFSKEDIATMMLAGDLGKPDHVSDVGGQFGLSAKGEDAIKDLQVWSDDGDLVVTRGTSAPSGVARLLGPVSCKAYVGVVAHRYYMG